MRIKNGRHRSGKSGWYYQNLVWTSFISWNQVLICKKLSMKIIILIKNLSILYQAESINKIGIK